MAGRVRARSNATEAGTSVALRSTKTEMWKTYGGWKLGDFLGCLELFRVWIRTEQRTQSSSSEWLSIMVFLLPASEWFFFLALHKWNKAEMKELLQNNREDICPCIYYLFSSVICLTFFKRFLFRKTSKTSESSEDASFSLRALSPFSHSHSQHGETMEPLEETSRRLNCRALVRVPMVCKQSLMWWFCQITMQLE